MLAHAVLCLRGSCSTSWSSSEATVTVVLLLTLGVLSIRAVARDRDAAPWRRNRWRALPLRFKLGCWLLVTPFSAATLVVMLSQQRWWVTVLGYVAIIIVTLTHKSRVLAWYERNGYFAGRESDPTKPWPPLDRPDEA